MSTVRVARFSGRAGLGLTYVADIAVKNERESGALISVLTYFVHDRRASSLFSNARPAAAEIAAIH
jgi:hypothetical protein